MSIKELSTEIELKDLITSKNIVLDFYANWCGPCKALSVTLNSIKKEDSKVDYEIVKVNIDDHNELATEYSIRSLPTLVFLEERDGNLKKVFQKVGSMNKNLFLETVASVYEK